MLKVPLPEITHCYLTTALALSLSKMQFQIYTTFLLVCMTAFVSAAPVPLAVDVELREDIARDLQIEVIREPTCMRLMCL